MVELSLRHAQLFKSCRILSFGPPLSKVLTGKAHESREQDRRFHPPRQRPVYLEREGKKRKEALRGREDFVVVDEFDTIAPNREEGILHLLSDVIAYYYS